MKSKKYVTLNVEAFATVKRVFAKAVELDIALRQLAYDCADSQKDKDEEFERIEALRNALGNVEEIENIETFIPLINMNDGKCFTEFNKWVHVMAYPLSADQVLDFDRMVKPTA